MSERRVAPGAHLRDMDRAYALGAGEGLHFSGGYLELRDGRVFVYAAVDTGSAPAHQLRGAQRRQHDELKSTEPDGTLDHRARPIMSGRPWC